MIYFDVSDLDLEGYNKFIPYYLFPERPVFGGRERFSDALEGIGGNESLEGSRIAEVNLASLCEKYGGGGHARVAAISFGPGRFGARASGGEGNCRQRCGSDVRTLAAQAAPLERSSARVTIFVSWAGSSMVEQLTLNQRVAGSSPARLTTPFPELQCNELVDLRASSVLRSNLRTSENKTPATCRQPASATSGITCM